MAEQTITAREVKFAIQACATASERAKAADAADEVKKAAMMGVFERLLGIKTGTELGALTPKEIEKIAKARIRRGEVTLEGFTLEQLVKVIALSTTRRSVSWKDAFIAELGEAKAAELQKSAEATHSYKFVTAELGVEAESAVAG